MATTQELLQREVWLLMHEAIKDSEENEGLENEQDMEEDDAAIFEAAHQLRQIGDTFNLDAGKHKNKEEVCSEIANILKDKAHEIEKKYGKDLQNILGKRNLFSSGVLGMAYNCMTSGISGWFNQESGQKEKMAVVYNVVSCVGAALRNSGKDVSSELNIITALGGQFLLDKCPSNGSYVEAITA